MSDDQTQREICKKYGAEFVASPLGMKVGISAGALRCELPLHGLRHAPVADTTGWFIWSGEYSDTADFFEPLHVEHLAEFCPQLIRFLGLSPGWRFMSHDGHEDVWFDEKLLET